MSSVRDPSAKAASRRRARTREASARARALAAASLPPAAAPGDAAWRDALARMEQVCRDLLAYETELEASNAALEESQRFIAGVLAAMSDVLVVCDRRGVIEDVNAALAALTGRPAEAWRGRPAADICADAASRERLAGMLARCRRAPVAEVELRVGGGAPVSFNATPRRDGGARPLGAVLTGRPLGELKRAYDELRAAHQELQRAQQRLLQSEKMASLGLLVAGVAHELNNPVSFVVGNVHVLRRYLPRLRRYLDAVDAGAPAAERRRLRQELRIDRLLADLDGLIDGTVEGAERARETVEALRRFAMPGGGEQRDFDLGEAVEQAVRWAARSGAGAVSVALDLAPGMTARGAAGELQQVVVNLLHNARDAGARRVSITGRPRCEWAEIVFRDDGPGIAEANLPRVFDPFFTTKPVGQGMGLGLAISYGIVQRHGGVLEAANHPDGGAVFTLRLPLAAAAPRPDCGAAGGRATAAGTRQP